MCKQFWVNRGSLILYEVKKKKTRFQRASLPSTTGKII